MAFAEGLVAFAEGLVAFVPHGFPRFCSIVLEPTSTQPLKVDSTVLERTMGDGDTHGKR